MLVYYLYDTPKHRKAHTPTLTCFAPVLVYKLQFISIIENSG